MKTSLRKVIGQELGPRRGAVAHVRHIGPCGQWRAANSPSPQKVLLPVVRTPNPTAVFHNALDRQTDRSFTGKFGDYRPVRL